MKTKSMRKHADTILESDFIDVAAEVKRMRGDLWKLAAELIDAIRESKDFTEEKQR